MGQMKNDSRAGVKLRLEFDNGILSYSGVMHLVTREFLPTIEVGERR